MSNKELVIESVRRLTEAVSLQEIAEEIDILARIREGIADADAGRVTPHDQVRELVRQWTA